MVAVVVVGGVWFVGSFFGRLVVDKVFRQVANPRSGPNTPLGTLGLTEQKCAKVCRVSWFSGAGSLALSGRFADT